MVELMETSGKCSLAIEVIDGFIENDEITCQKWFEEKIQSGCTQVSVLVKLDQMKICQTSTKAFMEDIIWSLRNYKKMGHLAIVAHSNIVKALVPIDNLFFFSGRAKDVTKGISIFHK